MFLSFCAFIMGLAICPEREAVAKVMKDSKLIVQTIYKRKRSRMGIKRFFSLFGPNRRMAIDLRHAYHETVDRMNDKKEATLQLLYRISTARTLAKAEKEDLFNQAIEELQEKMLSLTHSFRV